MVDVIAVCIMPAANRYADVFEGLLSTNPCLRAYIPFRRKILRIANWKCGLGPTTCKYSQKIVFVEGSTTAKDHTRGLVAHARHTRAQP